MASWAAASSWPAGGYARQYSTQYALQYALQNAQQYTQQHAAGAAYYPAAGTFWTCSRP